MGVPRRGGEIFATQFRNTRRLAAASILLALGAGCQCAEKASVKRLNVEQASALVGESAEVTVLDVRTSEEFAAGHLPGARSAPMHADQFNEAVAQLDRNDVYLVHCQAGVPGGRAEQALQRLEELGFTRLHHLEGGFAAWEEAGEPVE
jgi:rhodanese-related sulfurtransferase